MKLSATSALPLLTSIAMTLLFNATATLALCCRDNESGQCNNINASECPVNSSFADNCCGPPPGEAAAETMIDQVERQLSKSEGEDEVGGQE